MILAESSNQQPVIIEYNHGKGSVLASTYAIEWMHNNSSIQDDYQVFYNEVLQHLLKSSVTKVKWISIKKNEITIEPGKTNSVQFMLHADGLDVGLYEAHLVGYTEQLGELNTHILADISLDVKQGVNTDEPYNDIPSKPELSQNYPNPFNPSTTINYGIPVASEVRLVVYNLLGQKVQTLVNTRQQAGRYISRFDATNLSSGIYFYQLYLNDQIVETKQMLLIK